MNFETLKAGVITAGSGRGFVVESASERLVITAAHCLPSLPPAQSFFEPKKRSYGPLLAPLGDEPRAWAVCRFIDPIADIAVLGLPDNPHADEYTALIEAATALSIGDSLRNPVNFWVPARLLSLDHRRWFSCTVRHYGGPLWITHPAEVIHAEMSGSPIVTEIGTAIGVVCTAAAPWEGGPNPRLTHNLPGWLLRDTL
ncbi:MAG TPA: serine protease [Candidatus Dormibacteraeota bacterium]|nr:serine protease [Candidatus Dormibacteraeota bacterium]